MQYNITDSQIYHGVPERGGQAVPSLEPLFIKRYFYEMIFVQFGISTVKNSSPVSGRSLAVRDIFFFA